DHRHRGIKAIGHVNGMRGRVHRHSDWITPYRYDRHSPGEFRGLHQSRSHCSGRKDERAGGYDAHARQTGTGMNLILVLFHGSSPLPIPSENFAPRCKKSGFRRVKSLKPLPPPPRLRRAKELLNRQGADGSDITDGAFSLSRRAEGEELRAVEAGGKNSWRASAG